ncbi:MAG: phage BR0599 family protein [Actinomycetota bacterium]
MSPRAIDQPEKESYYLVTFTYGDPADPDFAFYTNRDQDVFPHISTPSLAVKLPQNSGLFEDGLCEIELPNDAFSNRLTDGHPTSPTRVEVVEMTRPLEGGPTATRLMLFVGDVVSTIRNAGGNSRMRKIKALPVKQFLDIPMGMPANHECGYTFNGAGCNPPGVGAGGPVGGVSTSRVILSIEGKKVTLTSGLTGTDRHPWQRGHISLDGIIVEIRDWDSVAADVLYLTRQPPTYWVGQTIFVEAGCDKSVERCRLWDNEQNFGGPGYAIPAYNPVFEDRP